jgi:hypothetical protein
MDQKERNQKQFEMSKTHPDRLESLCCFINNGKDLVQEQLDATIKEAKDKGYSIITADFSDKGKCMKGLIIFKEIDGVELAYNPIWSVDKNISYSENDIRVISKKDKKEIWMDDINSIALEVTELIQKRLKEHGIEVKDEQEDEFYVPIFNALEKYANGDYRNNN